MFRNDGEHSMVRRLGTRMRTEGPSRPNDRGNASLRSLRVGPGLLIDGTRSAGDIRAEVINDSDGPRSVILVAAGDNPWRQSVSLGPREKVILTLPKE